MRETLVDEPQSQTYTAFFDVEMQAAAKRIEHSVNDLKSMLSEKLEDGTLAAERLLKHGRFAVEDGIDETAHSIKRNPFGSLAIAFGAGVTVGFLLPRLGRK